MRIKTHDFLPEGEQLNFKLVLGNDVVWLKGTVAYSGFLPDKQSVSGIQFTELSARDHSLLQNYLATLKDLPKPQGMLSAAKRKDVGTDRRKMSDP